MNQRKGRRGGSSRREFLYAIGGITGAAISGWVLVSRLRAVRKATADPFVSHMGPVLAEGLVVTSTAEGADVLRGHDPAQRSLICRVNHTGRYVLEEMDGRKSAEELSKALAAELQSPPADMEGLASGVACFLAELGRAGMLREPFYVNIYSGEVTA